MIAPNHSDSARCLADSDPGELVQVRLLLFEFVRARCRELEIRPGEILRCVASEERGVRVAKPDGRTMVVPEECARFIGVEKFGERSTNGAVGRSVPPAPGRMDGSRAPRWSRPRRERSDM